MRKAEDKRGKSMKNYLLCLDGGGTRTVVCTADPKGNVLERFVSGALNINGQSRDKTEKTLNDIVALLSERGYSVTECVGIGAGTAGISNPEVRLFLENWFDQAGFLCPLFLYGDHETALAAAFGAGQSGAILISGTGSICLGKDEQAKEYRAGGYGHIIDDAGGGYAIGRDVLTALVYGEDGRGCPTILRQLVYEKLKLGSLPELMGYLYAPERTKKDIAALAVLAGEGAKAGDRAALSILQKAAVDLVRMATAVLNAMPGPKRLVVSGSVLLHNDMVREQVKTEMTKAFPGLVWKEAEADAAYGALQLLLGENLG